jgi:hypothetical protein
MKTQDTAMTALRPRQKPDPKSMIDEIRRATGRAGDLDFYSRMEVNHWYRFCWWEGQTWTGRKDGEDLDPRKTFPWTGASDARVPLIDEVINERVDQLMVAFDLARFRVGPRDLSADNNVQNRSAVWSGVAEYYQDESREEMRTAVCQWVDWADEFGHAVLYVGWKEKLQLERKTIRAADLLELRAGAALTAAQNAALVEAQAAGIEVEDPSQLISHEQQVAIMAGVEAMLAEDVLSTEVTEELVASILQWDPEMPESEARRIASVMSLDGEVEYFAPYVAESQPCWTALLPYIDVLYPPEVRKIQDSPWVAMTEWLTEVELREKVTAEGWSQAWVERVLERPGKAYDFGTEMWADRRNWVMSGGMVGIGVHNTSDEDAPIYQVLHVYYRATAQAGVPCMYRTVLSGWVEDLEGFHEACPYAHGKYPFRERVREIRAKSMIESRGVGEVSFSDQVALKVHRDQLNDHASLQLLPPAEVPIQQGGGRFPALRPGVQIPRRTTGTGAAGINWLKPPGNPAVSERAEQDIRMSVDRYWGRGAAVDPEVKLTRARARTGHFLGDVREVWKLTFQAIQEYAPEEIRVASVGGLPVDLQVSRQDIQGQVSLDLSFDPADFDLDTVMKKLRVLNEGLLPLDRRGSINTYNIVRAAVSAVMPQWVREIVPQSEEQTLQSEIEQEDQVLGQLLLGLEQPYIPGGDHRARLDLLQRRLQAKNPDGSPVAAVRILQANPDLAELVTNRMKFHKHQLDQQQNAVTGRVGVEPVQQDQQEQQEVAP